MPLRPKTGLAEADPAVTTPCGFDIVPTLSTRHQWFSCVPLLASHLTRFFPGLFLLRSRPWLLTTAAEGGLEPAPASRFRGAYPHRSGSYTHWALLGPLRSWRTIVRIGDYIGVKLHSPFGVPPSLQQTIHIQVGQHGAGDSTNGFPATAGVRGTVEFDTPSGARISVLGLRANAIPTARISPSRRSRCWRRSARAAAAWPTSLPAAAGRPP